MGAPPTHPTYRFRRLRHDNATKGYRFTLEASDAATDAILARCDVMGRVPFATHAIVDDAQGTWHLAPNRAVMPSRWLLTGPDGALALQFDQRLGTKLLNPFRSTGLVLRDAIGAERFRLVDIRKSTLDRILGPGPSDWTILRGPTPIATLTRLAPTTATPMAPAGWRQRVAEWLSEGDLALASLGAAAPLAPAEALALALLLDELNQPASTA